MNNPVQSSQSAGRTSSPTSGQTFGQAQARTPEQSLEQVAQEPVCTFIVPGLNEGLTTTAQIPPGIARLLARATKVSTPHAGYEDALLCALGHPPLTRAELPAAQCTYIADFNESAATGCVRADPVYLRADRDHARLMPPESLSITSAEADALCDTLNAHFEEDGLRFFVGKKNRWYVVASEPPYSHTLLDAAPMNQAAGRDVAHFLPHGKASARWRGLANEVQMLLYNHPVNQARDQQGMPPVNALWFWGAGVFSPPQQRKVRRVFTDTAFGVGLARLSGLTAYPLQDTQAFLSSAQPSTIGQGIVIVDTGMLESLLIGDNAGVSARLTQLADTSIERVSKLVQQGRFKHLVIDSCDGQAFVVSRWSLLKFWIR